MSCGEIVRVDFRPHPVLAHAHAQTLFPALCRPIPALDYDLERWELEDGDFVDLGWFARPLKGQPIAVLVHGLTGGFESKYLRATAARLQSMGWAGVMLQLRGAGDTPNRLPQAYHQGDTADLLALVQRLRRVHGAVPIATIGWSLGGNIVLKLAGEMGNAHPVDFVAAASVPFQLEPCARRLREGFSRVYQHKLMKELKQAARRKAECVALPAGVKLSATLGADDFFAFDDAWTAPLNGFADARDYYARTQCCQFLAAIRRPTLIVHSLDDPFMRPDIVPQAGDLAPQVRLELTERGGHVGFIGSTAWGAPKWWLEQRLGAWLEQCVPQTQSSSRLRASLEA